MPCGFGFSGKEKGMDGMMKAYKEMSREELLSLKEELDKQFADAKGKGL